MPVLSRAWATPLTIGAFCIVAFTGVLMFFHVQLGLSQLAHEWLGWLLVAAVGLHLVVNAPAFKRYFTAKGPARGLLAGAALALVGICLWPVAAENASPPALAIGAVANAPIAAAAGLVGKPTPQALADLAAVGIHARDGAQTLREATHGDRAQMGLALRALYATPATPSTPSTTPPQTPAGKTTGAS